VALAVNRPLASKPEQVPNSPDALTQAEAIQVQGGSRNKGFCLCAQQCLHYASPSIEEFSFRPFKVRTYTGGRSRKQGPEKERTRNPKPLTRNSAGSADS